MGHYSGLFLQIEITRLVMPVKRLDEIDIRTKRLVVTTWDRNIQSQSFLDTFKNSGGRKNAAVVTSV